jgi:hypothetical protein
VVPALALRTLDVGGVEDPLELGRGVGRGVRAILAAERELRVRASAAVRAGDLERHDRRRLMSFITAREET